MICGSLPPANTPRTSRRPIASPATIEARTTSPMWPRSPRGGGGGDAGWGDCCGHESHSLLLTWTLMSDLLSQTVTSNLNGVK